MGMKNALKHQKYVFYWVLMKIDYFFVDDNIDWYFTFIE